MILILLVIGDVETVLWFLCPYQHYELYRYVAHGCLMIIGKSWENVRSQQDSPSQKIVGGKTIFVYSIYPFQLCSSLAIPIWKYLSHPKPKTSSSLQILALMACCACSDCRYSLFLRLSAKAFRMKSMHHVRSTRRCHHTGRAINSPLPTQWPGTFNQQVVEPAPKKSVPVGRCPKQLFPKGN